PAYEARLTRSTACLWEGGSVATHDIGRDLASGESMHLLEGLAEFKLDWSRGGHATVSLEGPAAMMLATDGMPTLRFGRLSATINTSQKPFVLDTSIGRLSLADCGAIGISAFGNEGEIHVFSGVASYDAAWRSPDQTSPLTIEAGQSIRIQTGENGEPQITWDKADAEYFAAQVSMASDSLVISPAYVAAVKKAGPIGYWRFEHDDWPNVPNAMGPRLTCHVDGSLGRAVYQNNQAVEFGVTDQGGDIISSDVIDDSIHDSYSIEFWMKPSHYHVGAVVSLVGEAPTPGGVVPHGMLVELGGTGRIPTANQHPGCIRFLHRSPAGRNLNLGTSCYSETPYTLRKWQHVVATKDGPKMRLYANGELVAEGEDPSELPSGLRLLVGRLYPGSGDRPFIGQLDELALYNRALTPAEIGAHYHLIRPKKADRSST
ncbi:MAG TPA: LamG domain-containing protein, partial [Pirellulales bacterium]